MTVAQELDKSHALLGNVARHLNFHCQTHLISIDCPLCQLRSQLMTADEAISAWRAQTRYLARSVAQSSAAIALGIQNMACSWCIDYEAELVEHHYSLIDSVDTNN